MSEQNEHPPSEVEPEAEVVDMNLILRELSPAQKCSRDWAQRFFASATDTDDDGGDIPA